MELSENSVQSLGSVLAMLLASYYSAGRITSLDGSKQESKHISRIRRFVLNSHIKKLLNNIKYFNIIFNHIHFQSSASHNFSVNQISNVRSAMTIGSERDSEFTGYPQIV
jgi:hypothetical protein